MRARIHSPKQRNLPVKRDTCRSNRRKPIHVTPDTPDMPDTPRDGGRAATRHVRLYNQQLPQSALGSNPPLQAMKDWHNLKPGLFKKQAYYLPGCDSYTLEQLSEAIVRLKV